MSSNSSGASRIRWFLFGVIGAAAVGAYFVPVRDCKSCIGTGGLKIGTAVDLSCKKCGGDGKQTVFDIVRAGIKGK